jgi:MFS family permease
VGWPTFGYAWVQTRGHHRIGVRSDSRASLYRVAKLVGLPSISVSVLLFGRLVLGVGESFIITGAQSWGLGILGVQNTSKVLAWLGSAMFGAFAAGAPVGTFLYGRYGFSAIGLATFAYLSQRCCRSFHYARPPLGHECALGS